MDTTIAGLQVRINTQLGKICMLAINHSKDVSLLVVRQGRVAGPDLREQGRPLWRVGVKHPLANGANDDRSTEDRGNRYSEMSRKI